MKRDFVAELQAIIKRADNRKPAQPVPDTETLYNVHMRSLPPGVDKIVGIGFDLAAARQALLTLFKAREDRKHDGRWLYYDIVPQGATEKERSIFFNGHIIIKEVVI